MEGTTKSGINFDVDLSKGNIFKEGFKMTKDVHFEAVIAELQKMGWNRPDKPSGFVNDTIVAVKKVLEAERNANIQAELDKTVQVGTFDAKKELGAIDL